MSGPEGIPSNDRPLPAHRAWQIGWIGAVALAVVVGAVVLIGSGHPHGGLTVAELAPTKASSSTTSTSVATTTEPAPATTSPSPTTSLPPTSTLPQGIEGSADTTTTAPSPSFSVSPTSAGIGVVAHASGAGCQGSGDGVSLSLFAPDGQPSPGSGGEARPDGTWSVPFEYPVNASLPGHYKVVATCENSTTNQEIFVYPPQYITFTGQPAPVDPSLVPSTPPPGWTGPWPPTSSTPG